MRHGRGRVWVATLAPLFLACASDALPEAHDGSDMLPIASAASAGALRTEARAPEWRPPSARPPAGAAPDTPPPEPAPLVDPGLPEWLPIAAPQAAHLDATAIDVLVEACAESGSDALIVLQDGKLVVERHFGTAPGPIQTMSVTKGFVGLAIGMLLGEGKIHSLDMPIGTWLPDWRYNDYARVTLRHVLQHTSGLYHESETYPLTVRTDRLLYARNLPLVGEPGTKFAYNNEATLLLAAVVARTAGMPLDAYLTKKLFEPLGVHELSWEHDGAGTPATFSGLALAPRDLATVGQVLLDGGMWHGRELVPARYVREAQKPSAANPEHGLLTWLLYDGPYFVPSAAHREMLAAAGFNASMTLAVLDGRRFESVARYWLEVGALLDEAERRALEALATPERPPFDTIPAALVGQAYKGWLGQYLLVYPDARVVAVRMHRVPGGRTSEREDDEHGLSAFPRLVRAAIRPGAG